MNLVPPPASSAGRGWSGGFADATIDAQRIFRVLLQAMAEPGRVSSVPALVRPPPPAAPAAAGVLAAVADADTPVWLGRAAASSADLAYWLRFHTGAPIAERPGEAHFALVTDASALPPFGSFMLGTDKYPDRSSTLIIQVAALSGGRPLLLQGPGIMGTRAIAPAGLPDSFEAELARNRKLFPRGIDVVLATDDAIVGPPRTVRLAREDR